MSPVERVLAGLHAAGVVAQVRRFDSPVPTAVAAAEALGCPVGAIANSLVFSADDEPLLVLTSGAHRVDTAKVAAQLGVAKVRRATPELVRSATGQEIGGVGPVGHPAPLRTIVDVDLAAFEVLWAGGGDHSTMVALTYPDLLQATGGQESVVA